MPRKIVYNDVKNLVNNLGYTLITKTYDKAISEIIIKDKEGYYYTTSYNKLQQKKMPEKFHKYNKYSIYNIQLVLNHKNKQYKLVTKEYLNSNQKIVFKDLCGYYYTNTIEDIKINDVFWAFSSSNKYTIQNISLWLQINNIKLKIISDNFKSAIKKLVFINKEGYLFSTTWNQLQQGHLPEKFSKSNKFTIKNIKLWCKINQKPFKILSEEYIDSSNLNKLKWKCLKENCGEIFYASWTSIINGHGCGVCEGRQVTLKNCLATMNPDLASEWHPTKNIGLTPYDVSVSSNKSVWWRCNKNHKHEWNIKINARKYNGCPYCAGQLPSEDYNLLIINPTLCEEWNYNKNKKMPNEYTPNTNKKVWWKCKECGHEWKASISDRNGKHKTGCPECFKSKGEQRIKDVLNNNNCIYNREYIFNDLLSDLGNPLRFDFAIFYDEKKTKLKCLIEYDGEFHYKKIYNEQNFKTLQYHDNLKNEYCKIHNIKLIRIPYWEFDNVENILCKIIKENVI